MIDRDAIVTEQLVQSQEWKELRKSYNAVHWLCYQQWQEWAVKDKMQVGTLLQIYDALPVAQAMAAKGSKK